MLKVRYPILNFLLLVLGVLLNSTPDGIHQSPEVSEILLKESFELDPKAGGLWLPDFFDACTGANES